jgi:hypothetical protein
LREGWLFLSKQRLQPLDQGADTGAEDDHKRILIFMRPILALANPHIPSGVQINGCFASWFYHQIVCFKVVPVKIAGLIFWFNTKTSVFTGFFVRYLAEGVSAQMNKIIQQK